jgi:hypothetical protein
MVPPGAEGPATISVLAKPKYGFGRWPYNWWAPRASINGRLVTLVWDEQTPIPVPPGRYEVAVWTRWLFLPHMGRSSVITHLEPGAFVHVEWAPPVVSFLEGSIRAYPVDLTASRHLGPAPSWLGDPTGRHHFRWWDGSQWSDQVNDGGVSSHDPV